MAAAGSRRPRSRPRPAGARLVLAEQLAGSLARCAADLRPRFPDIAQSLDDVRQAADRAWPSIWKNSSAA